MKNERYMMKDLSRASVSGTRRNRRDGIVLFFVIDLRCGTVAVLNILNLLGRWWRGSLTVLSGWRNATQRSLVEDQSSRASLETRVATLAGPVTVARLA